MHCVIAHEEVNTVDLIGFKALTYIHTYLRVLVIGWRTYMHSVFRLIEVICSTLLCMNLPDLVMNPTHTPTWALRNNWRDYAWTVLCLTNSVFHVPSHLPLPSLPGAQPDHHPADPDAKVKGCMSTCVKLYHAALALYFGGRAPEAHDATHVWRPFLVYMTVGLTSGY